MIHLLKLGELKSKEPAIVKARAQTSVKLSRKCAGWLSEEDPALAEHSALDLFTTLCKRFELVLTRHLSRLFSRDAPIDLLEAFALCLIDEIAGVVSVRSIAPEPCVRNTEVPDVDTHAIAACERVTEGTHLTFTNF